MNVTPEQARDSLNEIREVSARMRKAIAAAGASGQLMIWGIVWLVAFVACGIRPESVGLIWCVCAVCGTIASTILGIRTGSQLESTDDSRQGIRFVLLWVAMFIYIAVWTWLLRPTSGMQLAAFICTAVMFLYVVMGLWFQTWFLGGLGIGITLLTMIGYQMLPEYFYFWMAATGGGSLFVSGLYIHRAWK